MASSFEIVVSRTGVGELTRITQFHSLEYVLTENDIGALTLTLPDTYPANIFVTDDILEIYRTLDGVISLEGETVWFVRETSYTLNSAGEWVLKVVAFDAKELLKRRIVNSYAGSAAALKTDNADDMMRAIVREQLGASAAADAGGIRYIIDVEADLGVNASITKGFSWRNVLIVLQDIADQLRNNGQRVVFNVVKQVGAFNNLIFRVKNERWGVDRTQLSGDALIFSPENGALSDVEITFNAREEVNFGRVGGEGEGELRTVGTGGILRSIGRSYWNRREAFVDARNSKQPDELVSELSAFLIAHEAYTVFRGTVQQTGDLRYGVHYRWGDEVVATAHGFTFDTVISAVHVVASAGGETINITLTNEPR